MNSYSFFPVIYAVNHSCFLNKIDQLQIYSNDHVSKICKNSYCILSFPCLKRKSFYFYDDIRFNVIASSTSSLFRHKSLMFFIFTISLFNLVDPIALLFTLNFELSCFKQIVIKLDAKHFSGCYIKQHCKIYHLLIILNYFVLE